VVSSECLIPHDTNKAAKYTNCAMLQEIKISTLYNSRNVRLCGMNSDFVTGSVMVCAQPLRRFSSNVMKCNLMSVSVDKSLFFKTEVITR